MTIDDLWQEYREMCCPGESGEALHWQHVAFLAGVATTIRHIGERPSCFQELRASLLKWAETQQAETN